MDALAIFNSFEAVFWIGIGIVVFQRSRVSRTRKRLGLIAAAWFVLFGISDIFEVYTGAWYRPWQLLAYKGICIAILISCGLAYRKGLVLPKTPE